MALELAEDPSVVEATGPGTAKDAEVVYDDDAGPGADVTYEVSGDGVKETITLDRAAALGSDGAVSFTLAVSKGLRPVLAGDVVTVVDGKDQVMFTIPAPYSPNDDIASTTAATSATGGTTSTSEAVNPDRSALGLDWQLVGSLDEYREWTCCRPDRSGRRTPLTQLTMPATVCFARRYGVVSH